MKKRLLPILLSAIILLSAFSGCSVSGRGVSSLPADPEGQLLRAAVLYDGRSGDEGYKDTLSQLQQALILSFSVEAVDIGRSYDLSRFDILYPDEGILGSPSFSELSQKIIDFTAAGGSVLLPNTFYDSFPREFLGAQDFVKIEKYPESLEFQKVSEDFSELQELIKTFSQIYEKLPNSDALKSFDYGYAAVTDTATALASCAEGALYTVNEYGNGLVFFTSPLLPNSFAANGFSTQAENAQQEDFSQTIASANQMLLSYFAGCYAKREYGFAAYRSFGSFGSPSMAWMLDITETTDIEENPAGLFAKLSREYGQIPSYSISRCVGEHDFRTESISYILAQSGNDGVSFPVDLYEGGYTGGTHGAAGDKWLSLASSHKALNVGEGESLCAFPWVGDITRNGISDIICGSSSGYIFLFEGRGMDSNFRVSEPVRLSDTEGNTLHVPAYSAPLIFDVNGDGARDLVCGSEGGKIYVAYGQGGINFAPFEEFLITPVTGPCFPQVGDIDEDGRDDLIIGSAEGRLLVYYGQSFDSLALEQGLFTELSESFAALGAWLAPQLCDVDSDGKNELIIGTAEGYVAVAEITDGVPAMDRFISCEETNALGNHNIVFGKNCVPIVADLNLDGKKDLICGSVEQGFACPIDSQYFPQREELSRQSEGAIEEGYDVVPRFTAPPDATVSNAGYEREAHIAAFETLGLPTDGLFCVADNISARDSDDYFKEGLIVEAPLSSGSSLPFFLKTQEGGNLLVLESTKLRGDMAEFYAKLGAPLCLSAGSGEVGASSQLATAALTAAEELGEEYHYNFVTARQLLLSSAAAYGLTLKLSGGESGNAYVFAPGYTDMGALYDSGYARSAGIRISLGSALAGKNYTSDASVWYRRGDDIFVSADKPFQIYETFFPRHPKHIESVNIAASIELKDRGCTVKFLDSGLMRCVVDGSAATESSGWKREEKDGKTIFTKYGEAQTLEISY